MSYQSSQPQMHEDRERYRQYIASLNLPIQEMDTLIDIVHSILSYFVDHAFHVQTDQITLQSVGKINANLLLDRVTIGDNPENQTADARTDGVESAFNQLGTIEP
ncbi:hypothetical protein K9B33_21805 [Sphingobium sp. 3R8]|uniref:hypothetical protein n=1 Tax=Sphingobium sp. 3R8 TaxID=2874921 RepID=UPI001CCCAE2E|nr:hypothetical protein [Sphingobium sp. 3R8]MBZ9650171.1 hypothetical protein [Sphingobium sp. 3R8]